jgi:hypothetical protein
MLIKKTSMFTNRDHECEIDVTQEQIDSWQNGELIQNAMPHLSADDREFLMTGCTPEEWEEAFGGS